MKVKAGSKIYRFKHLPQGRGVYFEVGPIGNEDGIDDESLQRWMDGMRAFRLFVSDRNKLVIEETERDEKMLGPFAKSPGLKIL